MSRSLVSTTVPARYLDRRELLASPLTEEGLRSQQQALQDSSTALYVGNLSFSTREDQIWNHFAPYGALQRVVMGLRQASLDAPKVPCGFCFVVYERRSSAAAALQALHESLLDDRQIHVSWDTGKGISRNRDGAAGNSSDRRWGRGVGGMQVVDGIRQNQDDGRGGLGALRLASLGVESAPVAAVAAAAGGATLQQERAGRQHPSAAAVRQQQAAANMANRVDGDDTRMNYYWVEERKRLQMRKRPRGGTNMKG